MTNSADPDQLASSEANWSESTLFAKAGYIRNLQDKGWKLSSASRVIWTWDHFYPNSALTTRLYSSLCHCCDRSFINEKKFTSSKVK